MTTFADLLETPGLNELIVRGVGEPRVRAVSRRFCDLSGSFMTEHYGYKIPIIHKITSKLIGRPDSGAARLKYLLKQKSYRDSAVSRSDGILPTVWAFVFQFGNCPELDYCRASITRAFLDAGVSPNLVDWIGWTPLHFIVSGLDLCQCGTGWNTKRYESAISDVQAAVDLLLASKIKINVNAQTRWGETALHITLSGYSLFHDQIAAVLYPKILRAGADLSLRNSYGDTPLHTALSNLPDNKPPVEIIEQFIAAGADIDARNDRDQTPADQAPEDFDIFSHYPCLRT